MKLRDIAHSRAGDKGDISNISVIAHDPKDYDFLRAFLTPERVKAALSSIVRGEVVRHEMPNVGALNFILSGALGGGVTRSLALDAHGKALSGSLLGMAIPSTKGEAS
ncbi:MAG: beta-lactamase [Caulobacteraceae bacterium]|nr:beta-lactamase [Caulobacteraceae bacterium]